MDWKELEQACSTCKKCSLGETKTNIVIGRGNREADLMFVGEAPGETEDKLGKPFVGLAGQLFDKYLIATGFEEDSYYICNILKCRPPKNRNPEQNEIDGCMDYLRAQTRLVKPKIIVCLGKVAACALIKPDFTMTSEHGKWYKKGNFMMCGIYHPSAILRDPSKKETMYKDMESVKKMLRDIKNGKDE